MKTLSIKLSLLTIVAAVVAACGGGGSSEQKAQAPNTLTAGPKIGDCFIWTPGTKYTKTNGYANLIVQEQFDGRQAIGAVELRSNGTRFGAEYTAVGDTDVQVLGVIDYDNNGAFNYQRVYSGFTFPINLAPGQKVQRTVTVTETRATPPSPAPTTQNEEWTFVGFENLTLGGRRFTDVCKVSSPSGSAGKTYVAWFAKGFGNIKYETLDAQGALVPGDGAELEKIVSAP
jgi:hypothetical protein